MKETKKEIKPSMNSKNFLSDLIEERVSVFFKDGTDVIGTLIWDDEHSIGVRFTLPEETENVLYYKSFIVSIKENYPKYSNYSKNDR